MWAPAFAGEIILMDYTGYGYEDGGLPSSNPGDVLVITAVAQSYDPMFNVAPGTQEVTIYIYDLASTGEFVSGADTYISYAGGKIEIYEDTNLDHDWGTLPPNAQLPTFTNGSLLLEGDFTDFILLANNFSATAGETQAAAVPEPASGLMAVFLIGGYFCLGRRRRQRDE